MVIQYRLRTGSWSHIPSVANENESSSVSAAAAGMALTIMNDAAAKANVERIMDRY